MAATSFRSTPQTRATAILHNRTASRAAPRTRPRPSSSRSTSSSNVTDLNTIAKSGGSNCDPAGGNHACIVTTKGNVNQQFLTALNNIRGSALGCAYSIPTPNAGALDFTKVNVQYTDGTTGAQETLGQVPDQAHCAGVSGDAWYYDDARNPTQILLCAATCSKLQADTKGEVDVLLGCQTIVY